MRVGQGSGEDYAAKRRGLSDTMMDRRMRGTWNQ